MAQPSNADLEKALQDLKLNNIYETFFVKNKTSKFDSLCSTLSSHEKKYAGVKELCSKLVLFSEKIAEHKNATERINYCSYLPYWLYGEVGKIYKEKPSELFGKIPFVKDLIKAWEEANKKIPQFKCIPYFDERVNLDELINRKISYIYLKKYDEIKRNVNANTKDKCNSYVTYLNYIDSLYKKYKKSDCNALFFTPNYADCSYSAKYDPKDLIYKANQCKAKATGSSDTSFFGFLLGDSSPRQSANVKGAPTQAQARVANVDTKVSGTGKSLSADGSQRDKETKGLAGITVGGDGSRGLSSSTRSSGLESSVNKGGSARPGVEATRRDTALTGVGVPGQGVHTVREYASETSSDAAPAIITIPPSTLETVNEQSDSNYIRNIVMAAAISSGLKSRFPKRKRKKKIFEHNYYEEYEKELARYESENESLDSQSDRYYLNYQSDQNSYY
ncbi:variable surface protein Vir12g [Plasmodium vivax North Korean]|uniref:Variable surface protein Vir12g n=1 Tax=Plasmodium vivax North Korean TaxID=1035514 RepID=A0A0J9TUH5_PLAVI|nr:variable surface protein Vir12g [Plasmodium vivax North Korean]